MLTKHEAKVTIADAARGCAAAEKSWREAAKALDCSISINGYGVHHDRHQLLYKLMDAQKHIHAAIEALHRIEWPTNEDYNVVD